ncbi:MAG TPA: LysR family transcriptional regulator [Solirubrobacterales bacterium]|nr:LysR family transcriptional regulator [Solirubrobacterales bacterium]
MELRQLLYTEAVARHRHFTRAAEELHVAQSALSHQIRRLEAELGTELFERTSRRVMPTEAGEAVAARARRVLAEIDGVRGEVDELRGLVRGRVAIGALLPAGGIEVTRLLARFTQMYPGIEVGLREGTAEDMRAMIEADELDVAFSLIHGDLPESTDGVRMSEEEVVVAYTPGTAPERDAVSARDLADVHLATPRSGSAIKLAIDDVFARAGLTMQVSLESGDPYLIRCLVSDGFGAAVLPASITRREGPPVETRPLRPRVRLPVYLVWRRDRHQSAAAAAFVDFVRGESTEPGP